MVLVPPSLTLRCVPAPAFRPKSRSTSTAAPLVQVMVTVPVPSLGVLALATTGSYVPNASAAVLMEQLGATVALTLKFDDAEPATATAAQAKAAPAATTATELRLKKTFIS